MRAVLKAPERFHQAARQPYIIGIEQGQKLGGRVANRDIPCGRYPTVRLLYVAQLRAQSLNERGDDLSSIISTAIVHEQDSPILESLRHNTFKCGRQELGGVVRRYDDVDFRHFCNNPNAHLWFPQPPNNTNREFLTRLGKLSLDDSEFYDAY